MKLPNPAHEAHDWVISRIAPDFKLLDAWALPVLGRREEVVEFAERLGSFDPARSGSRVTQVLFAVRLRLGEWLGWDDPSKQRPIPRCRETTLAVRLPEELRGSGTGPVITGTMDEAGFKVLYRTEDEWAAEVSNDTVHGVLHLGFVQKPDGLYGVQMGIYVKARGWRGELYMKLIEPFRRFIVYPALMRRIGRAWESDAAGRSGHTAGLG